MIFALFTLCYAKTFVEECMEPVNDMLLTFGYLFIGSSFLSTKYRIHSVFILASLFCMVIPFWNEYKSNAAGAMANLVFFVTYGGAMTAFITVASILFPSIGTYMYGTFAGYLIGIYILASQETWDKQTKGAILSTSYLFGASLGMFFPKLLTKAFSSIIAVMMLSIGLDSFSELGFKKRVHLYSQKLVIKESTDTKDSEYAKVYKFIGLWAILVIMKKYKVLSRPVIYVFSLVQNTFLQEKGSKLSYFGHELSKPFKYIQEKVIQVYLFVKYTLGSVMRIFTFAKKR